MAMMSMMSLFHDIFSLHSYGRGRVVGGGGGGGGGGGAFGIGS